MYGREKIPQEGVYWDSYHGKHVVVAVLDADEAANLGHSLAPNDMGGRQLIEWADEARMLDENTAWVPVRLR